MWTCIDDDISHRKNAHSSRVDPSDHHFWKGQCCCCSSHSHDHQHVKSEGCGSVIFGPKLKSCHLNFSFLVDKFSVHHRIICSTLSLSLCLSLCVSLTVCLSLCVSLSLCRLALLLWWMVCTVMRDVRNSSISKRSRSSCHLINLNRLGPPNDEVNLSPLPERCTKIEQLYISRNRSTPHPHAACFRAFFRMSQLLSSSLFLFLFFCSFLLQCFGFTHSRSLFASVRRIHWHDIAHTALIDGQQ